MKLDNLMNTVFETKALENASNIEKLKELVSENVTLDNVSSWLRDLKESQDSESIGSLASLMEQHPLGFEKYVIWKSETNGSRVRLHYWPQTKWPMESIHDHRFHFCAKVLKGYYIHEEYDVKNLEGDSVEVYLKKKEIINAGDTYFFPAGSFHRVTPSEEMTVSLIVRGEPVLPYSRVINPDTLKMRKAYGALQKFQSKIANLEAQLTN
ncbi:hypothetical protein [Bacillus solimangrovi]|uniref:Cysteine dioxygenase n=1 Tax=Bacillus solimangrovi TaxID=1305675 RepID=A0A1E5LJT8_9BACI|nr:hypothetical protein [Bacillus solimangrovi]OEH94288.1 hypothetical protein BFG57_08500 [Bacillus solimangrovi]